MRTSMAMAGLLLLVSIADAQAPPSARNTTKKMTSLFGALLIDKDLQRELRMTRDQVKRMDEIYLQYADPASVVFSQWGIRNLGITLDQREQFVLMKMKNNQEKFAVLNDKSGKYTVDERLKKLKEMDVAISKKSLSILRRSQLDKFERLKGNPYKLRKPDSGKHRTTKTRNPKPKTSPQR